MEKTKVVWEKTLLNENPAYSLRTLFAQNGSHSSPTISQAVFCPHTGTASGGTWAGDLSGGDGGEC